MPAPQQAGAGHLAVPSQLAADKDSPVRFLHDAAAFSGWKPRAAGRSRGRGALAPGGGCKQAQAAGAGDGLGPAVGAELGVQAAHVGLDGVR